MPRQPELEQATEPALIGVHLEEGEKRLLIQSGVRLESKPEISEIGRHGQTGGDGARFDLGTLALGDDFLSRLSSTFRASMASAPSFTARVSAFVEPKSSKRGEGRGR